MSDMLAAERITAQRFLQARRAQLAEARVLDEYMLRYARDLAASQPRCDETIAQLPTLSSVLPSDILLVFHNGQTYGITVSTILATAVPALVQTKTGILADGTETPVYFTTPFKSKCSQILFGAPNAYSGSDNAALTVRLKPGSVWNFGFTIIVGGGQTGSTCSLDFLPFGS